MEKKNKVFIATSIDGYIADEKGQIDWLHSIPNPENIDMGYSAFMNEIDALVMGRSTFDIVCGFEIDWPYEKPVFVLSNSMISIPKEYEDKAILVKGALNEILDTIHSKGYNQLYIDGGKTIQSFLREDLIDEMVITVIPYILGGGIPLFGDLSNKLAFECVETKHYLHEVAQNHYVRNK